ncbi:MAG: alpha/beta hydrolase [Parvularculaceae bacterium]|nr:alpha/beta hydrolase [Parvularculaceae bacterium]
MKRFLLAVLALVVLGAAAAGFVVWKATQGLDPAELEARYAAGVDRFIDVEGLRVRIREEGPADGPPIVLLHGFVVSLESFDGWARELSDEYRVIRFDLAGHGLTGPDPEKRYAPLERAEFVGAVMDALGIERAVIGGNSLGGLAAWRFAAAHPDRVTALVLVSPGAFPNQYVSDEPVAPPAAMVAFLRTATPTAVRKALEGVYHDDARITEARVALMSDMMRRRGNGQAFIDSINEFSLPDPTADLATIEAATLILWGEEDIVIPVAQASMMARAIPGSKLIVYPRIGHVPQEEDPATSAADVRAFLASLGGGS